MHAFRVMARHASLSFALAFPLLLACSGSVQESGDSTGSGGSMSGGGSSTGGSTTADGGTPGSGGDASTGGATGGGGNYVDCPSTVPTADSSCEGTLDCTYGDDPRWSCRTRATCSGTWQVTVPACDSEPLPEECPQEPPSGACTEGTSSCLYPDGTDCICANCGPNAPLCNVDDPYQWYCQPAPEGCPTYAPNLGTQCSQAPEDNCYYTCSYDLVCVEGVWTQRFSCPDCNSPDTPIATPSGERPVAELEAGDLVYSMHEGELAIVPIERVASKPQRHHTVMRVELETGRVLEISSGHPTADGRSFGQLRTGQMLDAVEIVRVARVPYEHERTYDLLPASDSGTYFAAGVLIGSTLASGSSSRLTISPMIHSPHGLCSD